MRWKLVCVVLVMQLAISAIKARHNKKSSKVLCQKWTSELKDCIADGYNLRLNKKLRRKCKLRSNAKSPAGVNESGNCRKVDKRYSKKCEVRCEDVGCFGGMEYDECASACPPTCANPSPACTKQCVKKCRCPNSAPILLEGECIPQNMCPTCVGGMEYDECASACPPTCANPSPVCTKQCVKKCRCPNSAPILLEGECIPQNMCPTCVGGMEYDECASACPPTCANPSPVCTKQCVKKCRCPNSAPILLEGECIPQNMCPTCVGGMEYDECASACPPTCANPSPVCTKQCVKKCRCPNSAPILLEGECIPQNMCPTCVGGMEYDECASACPPTCANPSPVCTKQCVKECRCPNTAPILNNGGCITKAEC